MEQHMSEPFLRGRQPKFVERNSPLLTLGGDFFLKSLVEDGDLCTIWDPADTGQKNFTGIIYRDRRGGIVVETSGSWIEGQTIAPDDSIRPRILHGRGKRLGAFSLHDTQVISGLSDSEVRASLGFFGHWVLSLIHI